MATEEGNQAPSPAPRRGERAAAPNGWRRFVPTTAIGLAVAVFCMAIGAAFSGAVLYAYYEYRLGKTNDRVDAFESGFGDAMDEALDRIGEERDSAVGQVQGQLDELERFAASGETLSGLLEKIQVSVYFVTTLDDAGAPAVGSAFVVFSDSEQSFLLTSFATVGSSATAPAPDITLVKGEERLSARLVSWDPPNDLALLSVDKPNMPRLEWGATDPPGKIGDRVFVVSGLGAAGGSISQGFVAGISAEGIQHDSPVGTAFQGGPLVDSDGEVLAVASRAYSPLGFNPEAVFFGVPIRNSCSQVIRCPDGQGQPG
ncbi:MAG: serine protease [Actinomycetota bacterium]|nr:serine protease [Actinomycetota bacterium]